MWCETCVLNNSMQESLRGWEQKLSRRIMGERKTEDGYTRNQIKRQELLQESGNSYADKIIMTVVAWAFGENSGGKES